jgi:hypothetical protein
MSGEQIHSVQNIESADDAEAMIKAAAILESHVEHQGIEIWQGARFVVRIPRENDGD